MRRRREEKERGEKGGMRGGRREGEEGRGKKGGGRREERQSYLGEVDVHDGSQQQHMLILLGVFELQIASCCQH